MKFKTKIPKIIHQIHMGDRPMSTEELNWQLTWKKYNPDWEFILWNDDKIKTIKMINQKHFEESDNYSMKSDVLRFEILYQIGGLYVDTDFECLRPLDSFFHNKDFIVCRQSPSGPTICGAFLASIKSHPFIKKLIDGIEKRSISHMGHHCTLKYGPSYLTELIDASDSLDPKYVYPFLWDKKHSSIDDLKSIYPDSYAAHHWKSSWIGHGSGIPKNQRSKIDDKPQT